MENEMTLAQQLAEMGVGGTAEAKMHTMQAKPAETVQTATVKILANLNANKAYLEGTGTEPADKLRCYKKLGEKYGVCVRHGVRYLDNVYAPGKKSYTVVGKKNAAKVCDMLISNVSSGKLDAEIAASIAANKRNK